MTPISVVHLPNPCLGILSFAPDGKASGVMGLLRIALAIAVTLAGATDIIIGNTGPLSYRLGLQNKVGLELAFQEVNAAGGVRGRNLTLVALNDGFRPDLIQTNFEELVGPRKAIMIACAVGTTAARIMGPLAVAKGIPYVGGMASAPELRFPFQEQYVNVRASNSDELVALVALLVQHLRVQRIACLYTNNTFSIEGLKVVEIALAHVGFELVAAVPLGDDEAAVAETILGSPQRPQAMIMMTLASPIARLLPLLKNDPRLDPECAFLMLSPASSLQRYMPDNQYWRNLYFSELLPLEDDPTSALARRFRMARAAFNVTVYPGGTLLFEAYVVGRLIASALSQVAGTEFTSEAFLDAIYRTRAFVLDDITLGLYNRIYAGCEALLCGCNQGLRSVFLQTMDNTTGAALPVVGLPSFHYPAFLCSSPIEGIKRPILFAQLIPAASPFWAAVGRELSRGISAAFAAANAIGGLQGRPLELIPFEYRGEEERAMAAAQHRYPLAGLLGSVVPHCRPNASRAIPDIAPFCFETRVYDAPAPFLPQVLHLQPTIALELMALVHYVLQQRLEPIHCLAPATAEGTRFLALCAQTLHHFQRRQFQRHSYTRAASALAGVDAGAVLVVGPHADLQELFEQLADKPDVHLLTAKRGALPLLADYNGTALPARAARLHFAELIYRDEMPPAPRGAGWAWRYGYTAGSAVWTALLSSQAKRAYTTPEDVLDTWYNVSAIRTVGMTLGPYYRSTCRFDGDQECLCNQGTNKLVVRPALIRSARPQHIYSSATCEVQYEPLQHNYTLAIVLGVAAAVVLLITGAVVAVLVVWYTNRRDNASAPKDERQPFCIVFTDIQSSTTLWASLPLQMPNVLDLHHRLIRKLIAQHKCYEVKTIGDCFMVAAQTPRQALGFALGVQRSFHAHDWDEEGVLDKLYLGHEEGQMEDEDHQKCWNGLRVRMGIHYGLGEIKLDPVTKGYDYYGTVVNTAARIEGICHGGQIAVSEAVHDFCNGRHAESYWTALGPQVLRGLSEPVNLWQVLPAGTLAGRQFPPLRVDDQPYEREHSTEVFSDLDGAPRVNSARGSGTMSNYGPSYTAYSSHFADHHFHEALGSDSYSLQEVCNITTALLQLLASAEDTFRKQTLKKLCQTFRVRLHGVSGALLDRTLKGLVMRLLPPAIREHRLQRFASGVSSVSNRTASMLQSQGAHLFT